LVQNLLNSVLDSRWRKHDKLVAVTTQFGRLFHTLTNFISKIVGYSVVSTVHTATQFVTIASSNSLEG